MSSKKITQGLVLVSLLTAALPQLGYGEPLQNRPNIPNAGTILHELEPERHVTPRPSAPKIDMQIPQEKQPEQQLTADVRKVVFECKDLDINDRLQPLTQGRLGKGMTFAQMQELAQAATLELRKEGYAMALVYVPVQDLDKGVLKLKAIIGRYGDVEINNHSQMTDERLLGYTYPARPGQLIKSQPLDKSLLILNEIPGMKVRASMVPGKKAGTAKIIIDADTLEKQGGYVFVDNYGSKSTGRWRYGVDYHYNNLSKVGDQIDIAYLASFEDMKNYQLRYTLPVGRDGAIARVSYSHMNYELGNRWDYLKGDGIANTLEVGVTIPMKRSLKYSSWYDLSYSRRALSDGLFDGMLDSKKTSNVFQAEIHGYVREDNYSTTYSISHSMGDLGMDTDYAKNTDILGTAGWFGKSNATVYHIQRLDDRWQLHVALSGQYADHNLDSSEDFYIGGANAVRAFPQGETGGDSGLLGTLEFRYRTGCPELQLTAFVDAGRVFYNKDGLAGDPSDNVRNIAGVGLGAIYTTSRNWYAKFDWATPWGNHYSSSEGQKIHNTYWLRVVKQF